MSHALISRSNDLSKLRDEGYEVDIQSNHLVIRNVPYVNNQCHVKRGLLVSTLDLNGDVTACPSTHQAFFVGEYPCDNNGQFLETIVNGKTQTNLGDDLIINYSFSSKPASGYQDYYHKMSTYIDILSGYARKIDPAVTAKTFGVIESKNTDSVFEYMDNASGRAGISAASAKLESERIAIIGLGGTGSYVLDLVAKTPVREVHLFDDDDFLQHNAFRSPGAASKEELRARYKKVEYLSERYGVMRRGIEAHAVRIDADNVGLLKGMTFVFVCIDNGAAKLPIIEYLEQEGISFIDVGIGIYFKEQDAKIGGHIRVTTSTGNKRACARQHIDFSEGGPNDIYGQNVQVADLNALNANLAVIKWKKLLGFYFDFDHEHHSTYTIDGNSLTNERHA